LLLFGSKRVFGSSKDFLGYKKTQQMLKGEPGKRCQRPPKAAAAPDAECQKTDLSRVQSAKAFLFATIATATLALSLARSLAGRFPFLLHFSSWSSLSPS
jgi:hypothetical protein